MVLASEAATRSRLVSAKSTAVSANSSMETLVLASPTFSMELPMLSRAKHESAAMVVAARLLI